MQRSQPAGGLFSIFLNVKALVGPFNKEEALVEAFSVIVKSSRTFVYSSNEVSGGCEAAGVSHLYLPGVEHHVGDTGVGQGGDQLLVAVLGQEEHGDPLHSHHHHQYHHHHHHYLQCRQSEAVKPGKVEKPGRAEN